MTDRQKIIKSLEWWCKNQKGEVLPLAYSAVVETLEALKDQSEIVLCNDCVYWDKGHTEECDNLDSVCFHNGWCKPDWFCADGKRR